jgi:hypothetical protein
VAFEKYYARKRDCCYDSMIQTYERRLLCVGVYEGRDDIGRTYMYVCVRVRMYIQDSLRLGVHERHHGTSHAFRSPRSRYESE